MNSHPFSPASEAQNKAGWWLVYPSEKYEFVSWDDNRNPIVMGKCQIHGNQLPPSRNFLVLQMGHDPEAMTDPYGSMLDANNTLGYIDGTCCYILHTWILWVMIHFRVVHENPSHFAATHPDHPATLGETTKKTCLANGAAPSMTERNSLTPGSRRSPPLTRPGRARTPAHADVHSPQGMFRTQETS